MSKPALAYLVKGEDAALAERKGREIIHGLVGEEDIALVIEEHNGGDLELGAVLAACSTPPFLSERRVVVVREASKMSAADTQALVHYLEAPLPTTVLVLVESPGSVPAKLLNAVKKVGELVDTSVGRNRQQWLSSRVRSSPVNLDSQATSRLADHLGEDLWRLDAILDTLGSAYGEGARLEADDVEPFLGAPGGVAPWELTDAIDRGDTEAALETLHRMLEGGQRHPLMLMSTLHRHYSNMLRLDGAGAASPEDAAALLGSRSTFAAGKALDLSRRMGTERLGLAMKLLADADLALRGMTAWTPEVVMEVLVARLSRLTRPARVRRAATTRSG